MVGTFLFLYFLCNTNSHSGIKKKKLNFILLGSKKVQISKLDFYGQFKLLIHSDYAQ